MPRRRISAAFIPWTVAGMVVVAFEAGSLVSKPVGLALMAVLGLLHCAYGFWAHGRMHITAPGVYLIGTGTFVFFPALYLAQYGASWDGTHLFPATAVGFFSQIALYYGWWSTRRLERRSPRVESAAAPAFAFWIGLALIMGGVLAEALLGLGPSTLAGAGAFLGVVLLAAGVLFGPSRPSLIQLAFIPLAGFFYVSSMFDGGGRLVLGGLAIAITLLINQRFPGRWLKFVAIVSLPTALTVLASYRSDLVFASRGGTETGLESVVWPLERFAQLLGMAAEGSIELAWGATFFAAAVFFIPRAIWEGKPDGLGAELTTVFRPDLIGVGHSEAALFYGEWIYNFGLAGVLIMIPVIGWLIEMLDRFLAGQSARPLASRRDLFFRVTSILLTASVLDLVWVGTFTYVSRSGMRLLVFSIIFVLFMWQINGQTDRARRTLQVHQHPR